MHGKLNKWVRWKPRVGDMNMDWIDEARKDGYLSKVLVNNTLGFGDNTILEIYKIHWPENHPDLKIEAI